MAKAYRFTSHTLANLFSISCEVWQFWYLLFSRPSPVSLFDVHALNEPRLKEVWWLTLLWDLLKYVLQLLSDVDMHVNMIFVLAPKWLVLKLASWLQILRYNDGEKYSSHMDYFQDAVSCEFPSIFIFIFIFYYTSFLSPSQVQFLCGFEALLTSNKKLINANCGWHSCDYHGWSSYIDDESDSILQEASISFSSTPVTTRMSLTAAKSDRRSQYLAWYKLLEVRSGTALQVQNVLGTHNLNNPAS